MIECILNIRDAIQISFIIHHLLIKPHWNFPQVVSYIPVVGEWHSLRVGGGRECGLSICGVVQLLSYVRLCNQVDLSTPGSPVLQYFPKFAQSHVGWVGDAVCDRALIHSPLSGWEKSFWSEHHRFVLSSTSCCSYAPLLSPSLPFPWPFFYSVSSWRGLAIL